jgi:hypothetical protein
MRYLLALALLACPAAFAQIQYSTKEGSGYQALDLATLDPAVSYSVRVANCVVPISMNLDAGSPDAAAPWPEKQVPCDYLGGEGKLVKFTPGTHTMTVTGAGYPTPLTATFTVIQPMPPEVKPATGTKITWTQATTNEDGSPLTNLAGVRIYSNGQKVAELGPTVTSWNPPATGTYDLVTFTTAGYESAHVQVAFTLATTSSPVDCQVGPWVSGTPGLWTPTICTSGTQTRAVPQTREIITPASNGGAACPALAQTITETQSCIVPPPVDVCKADPLTVKVTGWPGGTSGSRSLSYATNKAITSLSLTWPLKITVTDSRGCSATVAK